MRNNILLVLGAVLLLNIGCDPEGVQIGNEGVICVPGAAADGTTKVRAWDETPDDVIGGLAAWGAPTILRTDTTTEGRVMFENATYQFGPMCNVMFVDAEVALDFETSLKATMAGQLSISLDIPTAATGKLTTTDWEGEGVPAEAADTTLLVEAEVGSEFTGELRLETCDGGCTEESLGRFGAE